MNRDSTIRHSFLLVLFLSILVQAKSQDNPHLSFPEGDASWIVEVSPIEDKRRTRDKKENGDSTSADFEDERANLKQPRHMEVTRVGKLARTIVKWSDGSSSEVWQTEKPKRVFMDNPHPYGRRVIMIENPTRLDGYDSYAPDAKFFSWVSNKSLKGSEKKEGRETILYEYSFRPFGILMEDPLIVKYRLWVDSETKQPVAYDDGSYEYIFDFEQPIPTEALKLPSRFYKELEYARMVNPPFVRKGKFNPKENTKESKPQ